MNPATIAQFMIDQPLLGRLLFASVEMLVLAAAVWLGIRAFKPKSARLVSFLWLLVLAKPLVALAFGPIVPIVNLTIPAEPIVIETAQPLAEPATEYVEVITYETPIVASTPAPDPSAPPPTPLDIPRLIFTLWLIGITLVVLWAIVDRIRLARVVHRAAANKPASSRTSSATSSTPRSSPKTCAHPPSHSSIRPPINSSSIARKRSSPNSKSACKNGT